MTNPKVEPIEFRSALGQFPTGITIVTARASSGEKVGMTASSFNSVSMDPPLVLWSIGKNASNYHTFIEAEYFAVHVLSAQQSALSSQFSNKMDDRFCDIDCKNGLNSTPLLPEFAVCFQCSIAHRYDGGDHTILVGLVEQFENRGHKPLLFYGGAYAKLA